jgi:hypothetical protein
MFPQCPACRALPCCLLISALGPVLQSQQSLEVAGCLCKLSSCLGKASDSNNTWYFGMTPP